VPSIPALNCGADFKNELDVGIEVSPHAGKIKLSDGSVNRYKGITGGAFVGVKI